MSSAIVPTLFDRFAIFIKVLTQALGYACTPRAPRAHIDAISLFHKRVSRYLRRFRRFAEAADPAALNPKPRPHQSANPDRARPHPSLILPRRFGWLREIVPDPVHTQGISAAAGALLDLLRDPALAPLLETCPTLARTLRPHCHALGIRTLSYGLPLPFPPEQPGTPATPPPRPAPHAAPPPKALPQLSQAWPSQKLAL